MPAQWTAQLIGEMHLNGITKKQLAEEAGIRPEYVSMLLNGRREPRNAERMLRNAFERLLDKKNKV